MDELGSAVQLLQVSLHGVELAGKATLETIRMLQRFALFLESMAKLIGRGGKAVGKAPGKLKYHKKRGKTNIDNLKKKGGTIEVISISEKDYDNFQKKAKKWGILFSKNPTFKKDAVVYVSYAAEQAPVMEKILEAMKKEKLDRFEKLAREESDKLNLKGRERKEFMESFVEMKLHGYETENVKCSIEEYFQKSGLMDCTDQEFDQIMKEKFGSIYEEEVEKWQTDLKKKNFEETVNELSSWRKNSPPVYLCEKGEPDTYIKVSWDIRKNSDNGREYLNTEYEVFKDGIKQKCDEFAHGRFSHYTHKNGEASSDFGMEHWNNVIVEMKEKGGFSDEILFFQTKEEFEDYKNNLAKQKEQAKIFSENTRIREWEKRKEQGDVVLKVNRTDIVDYNAVEKTCKIDTGIRDEQGRNYYLWTSLDNVFYTKDQFEVLLDRNEKVTLSSYFEIYSVELPAEQVEKKEDIPDEEKTKKEESREEHKEEKKEEKKEEHKEEKKEEKKEEHKEEKKEEHKEEKKEEHKQEQKGGMGEKAKSTVKSSAKPKGNVFTDNMIKQDYNLSELEKLLNQAQKSSIHKTKKEVESPKVSEKKVR